MERPGRKSSASLSVVSGGLVHRVEPPSSLNDREAEFFRLVVAGKPADWFTPDTVPLLAEYARATTMCDRLAVLIEAAAEGGEAQEVKALLDMRDKESRRAMSLATKMRLSQQSTYNALSGDTAKRRGAQGAKPWQFGKS